MDAIEAKKFLHGASRAGVSPFQGEEVYKYGGQNGKGKKDY